MRRGAIWRSLYVQVLIAIAVGIVLGIFWPHFAQQLKPLGDGFIKLIRLLIAPIIFCTVVTGIAGMAKLRDVGKAGGLALLYFEVVSSIALLIGLVIVNVMKPGSGVDADAATLDAHAVAQYTTPGSLPGVTEFILNIIPTTFFGAFASGDVLQTLLLAVLFGFALHAVGGKANPLLQLVEETG
jgi:aerobic C4-dicarboxylate transport protein